MKYIDQLNLLTSKHEFAKLLGYNLKYLTAILYSTAPQDRYRKFTIPKRNNKGIREILEPNEKLKEIQKDLAKLLSNIYLELLNSSKSKKFLSRIPHGFIEDRSIITNAKLHKNKRYVFNIDLEDFFPSINFGRVMGFFHKNPCFALPKDISILIAHIACFNQCLPQGSPCSPVISNLIALDLDKRLNGLAKKHKLTYSRYADDISFSTNLNIFPEAIGLQVDNIWQVGEKLRYEITKAGFSINTSKVRMQFKDSRQTVTGIVVNKKLSVPREYIKNSRAILHQWILKPTLLSEEVKPLYGRLVYIHQVNSHNILLNKKDSLPSSHLLLHKLLWFKYFIYNLKLCILTEGITDKIYIESAYKILKDNNQTSTIDFHIINQTKLIKEILGLGGDKKLKGFIEKLKPIYIKKYLETGVYKEKNIIPKYPVIILFDRDNIKLWDTKERENIYNKNFIHISHNFYYMAIPKLSDKNYFSIEYYFHDSILNTDILSLKGEAIRLTTKENKDGSYTIDEEKGLSKIKFAKFIKENIKEPIQFKNFKRLFEIFEEINSDYNNNILPKLSK